jgi:hypothetical protein
VAKDQEKGVRSALGLGIAKASVAAAKVAAAASSFLSAGQSVKASASGGVGLWANRNAAVFGQQGASFGTLGSALMAAATADVKGYVTAGVWGGAEATLVSNTSGTNVSSHLGKVFVDAKKTTSVVATGPLRVTGTKGASMRADKTAGVWGRSRAHVGAAKKWGLIVDGKGVAVGKLESAEPFDKTRVSEERGVAVTADSISFRRGEARFELRNDHARLGIGENIGVRIDSGGIHVRGSNIHVDA